jgi:3-hydroxymyristoyl/3-hydroxydecanoyl-(acyl carrier protein) dehydratase
MRTYDAAALQRLLPHRYPFLLVDRVDVRRPGEMVSGYRRLTSTDWWLAGAPARAMPFTLVLEALAQTSGALIPDLADGVDRTVAFFIGADRVRPRGPAMSGDELQLDITLLRWRRGICRARGIAHVEDAIVLTAELSIAVRTTS